jgi:hypothetical protein
MAEIEFKRRGTPLWAVVLVLLVIAAALYALFGRGKATPVPQPADTGAAAPNAPATPAAGAPATPAAPAGPIPALAAWADSAKVPPSAEVAPYVSNGLRLLADALQARAPMAGAQILMIRAMADTVAMPASTPDKQLNATQAAFFATQFAMRDKPGAARLENAAQRLDLKTPLAKQRDDVQRFFKTASEVMRDPNQGLATPVGPNAPAPAAKKP